MNTLNSLWSLKSLSAPEDSIKQPRLNFLKVGGLGRVKITCPSHEFRKMKILQKLGNQELSKDSQNICCDQKFR